MTQPATDQAPRVVSADVPYAPSPSAPPAAVDKPSTPRRKAPAWYVRPQILAVVALVLVVAELVAFHFLGWLWALVANLVLLIVLFLAALAWRRKGKGGLLDRLLSGLGRGRRGGARSGRAGGCRWPGGAAGGRRGGLLGKLTGGRLGRRTGGAAGAGGSGSTGGKRGLLSGLRQRATAARTVRAGRSTGAGSSSGRKGGSGRGRGSGATGGGPSGSGTPGGRPGRKARAAAKRAERKGKLQGATGGGNGPGKSGGGSGNSTGRKGRSRKPGGLVDSFLKGWRQGATPTTKKALGKPAGPANGTTNGRPDSTPAPRARTGQPDATAQRQPTEQTPARPEPADPRHAAGPNEEGNDVTTIPQYSDDMSLQRWGANLRYAEEHAAEVARKYAEAEAYAAEYRRLYGQMAAGAETDMPASARLKADIQAVGQQANTADSADSWRGVANEAATLPTRYQQEHETDEDRLRAPRTSLAAEKRADVTTASQDN